MPKTDTQKLQELLAALTQQVEIVTMNVDKARAFYDFIDDIDDDSDFTDLMLALDEAQGRAYGPAGETSYLIVQIEPSK